MNETNGWSVNDRKKRVYGREKERKERRERERERRREKEREREKAAENGWRSESGDWRL